MGLRFSLAALAVLPFALWERHRSSAQFPIGRDDLLPIVTVGVLFFLALATQQVGFLATTVTNAGVLTGLYVVLVPILAFGVFRAFLGIIESFERRGFCDLTRIGMRRDASITSISPMSREKLGQGAKDQVEMIAMHCFH